MNLVAKKWVFLIQKPSRFSHWTQFLYYALKDQQSSTSAKKHPTPYSNTHHSIQAVQKNFNLTKFLALEETRQQELLRQHKC